MNKKVTLAILADLHYGDPSSVARKRCDIADILLMRAVYRLNRWIRPDTTLVLGDLLDDGNSSGAYERRVHLRSILDKLESPSIVIPGNHDGDVESFYRVFHRPKDIEDVCGIRFLAFMDQEEKGYNASRSIGDIERFRLARQGYSGTMVAIQHVCLSPPCQSEAPYNYTNAKEIIGAMNETGVMLSISGHHHPGADTIQNGPITFINAPGLCESPFFFLVVTLDHEHVSTERQQLAMPENLQLIDRHIHTQLAYCSENMTVERAIILAKDFGLAGVGFNGELSDVMVSLDLPSRETGCG